MNFLFIMTGFNRKLCAPVPASHVRSLSHHTHRCGRQHCQADATMSRAYLQSAQIHEIWADSILESHFRRRHGSGYNHLYRRKLHSWFVCNNVIVKQYCAVVSFMSKIKCVFERNELLLRELCLKKNLVSHTFFLKCLFFLM